MRTKRIIVLTAMLLLCIITTAQQTLPKPRPIRFVTDKANVLSAGEQSQLEHKLKQLSDVTSIQIVVVLIPSLDGNVIEDYANKLFRSWGIGQKKKNNGVLVLAAIDDHKIRIEVGYGLEGAIPDITAKRIITNDIKQAFKDHQYFAGLDSATNDLARAAVGEYNEPIVGTTPPVESFQPIFDEHRSINPLNALLYIGLFLIAFLVFLIDAVKKSVGWRPVNRGDSYVDSGGFLSDSLVDSDSSSNSGDFGGGDSGGGGASDSW